MDLGTLEWRLIPEQRHAGQGQMALDEIAAETVAAGGPATVRVYRWDPSTVSLGYAQDPAVIDREYCEREGIDLTRRPTGGGAIYHDVDGDISYSVVAPAAALPGELTESYRLLCEPLFDALARVGVDADFAEAERPAVFEPACYLRALHPAHDVVGPDGRKLSGNAQYRQRETVVQHGSLTVWRAAERHLAVFADPEATPERFRQRVGAVTDYADVSRAAVVEALETALASWAGAEEGGWTDAELAAARERASGKFGAPAWVEDRTDPT